MPPLNRPPALRTSDIYYSSVSLLMHGDVSNGGTVFADNGPRNDTITVAVGSPVTSTAQKKYGTASLSFPTGSDGLQAADNAAYECPTQDFTIECWIYLTNLGFFQHICSKYANTPSSDREHEWLVNTANNLQYVGTGTSGVNMTGTTVLTTSTWYHVALTRQGNVFTMWLNGVSDATTTVSTTLNAGNSNFYIGTVNVGTVASPSFTQNMNAGFIDEFRFTKGVARYTGTFTPPSGPFPNYG